MPIKELKHIARQQLTSKWTIVVLVTLMVVGINMFINNLPLTGFLTVIIYMIALTTIIYTVITGEQWVYLDIYHGNSIDITTPFQPFKDKQFKRVFLTNILKVIYNSLWFLVFLVPGIIKSYSYAMTDYIMKDYPNLDPSNVITESREIMHGNKWKLFLLQLSFAPLYLIPLAFLLGTGMYFQIDLFVNNPLSSWMTIAQSPEYSIMLILDNIPNIMLDASGYFFIGCIAITIISIIAVSLYVKPYYYMAKVNLYRTISEDEYPKGFSNTVE